MSYEKDKFFVTNEASEMQDKLEKYIKVRLKEMEEKIEKIVVERAMWF